MAQLWDMRIVNDTIKNPARGVDFSLYCPKRNRSSSGIWFGGLSLSQSLGAKYALQSDPTIIYGLVGGKGRLSRPIRLSEIKQKTAYNTYQIAGLPPTPITNPGRDAIAAVLRPLKARIFILSPMAKAGMFLQKT